MTEGTSRKEPVSEVTPVAPVDFCNRLQIRIILFHQFWQRTSPLFSFDDYLLHPPRRFVNMNRLKRLSYLSTFLEVRPSSSNSFLSEALTRASTAPGVTLFALLQSLRIIYTSKKQNLERKMERLRLNLTYELQRRERRNYVGMYIRRRVVN